MLTLVSTTPFARLLGALRWMRVPGIFVDLLALTYRYLFVLVDEAMTMRRAAAARGYAPRWLGQAALIGSLAGSLFVRSYERAERVYGAMLLRGYGSRLPGPLLPAAGARDGLALAAGAAILIAARVWAP